ncbi:MAG TPA: SRPBCC domain-containing protein [Puia sp.]|jgi:uncharacterized protein YndB with AHSA1/START domain|nr:SRPBCC domain-containing protein [Puia sp.]
MTKSIHHKFFFPHSAEVVWEYLTKAELMQQWLMPNDFLPIIGYDFEFRIKPMPQIDFDGIVYCKVLEITPFKKLSYSWKCGPGQGKITLDSVVVWQLHPKDKGTELSLEHSGFKEIENYTMYSITGDGWFKNIQKISELINASKHGTTNP